MPCRRPRTMDLRSLQFIYAKHIMIGSVSDDKDHPFTPDASFDNTLMPKQINHRLAYDIFK